MRISPDLSAVTLVCCGLAQEEEAALRARSKGFCQAMYVRRAAELEGHRPLGRSIVLVDVSQLGRELIAAVQAWNSSGHSSDVVARTILNPPMARDLLRAARRYPVSRVSLRHIHDICDAVKAFDRRDVGQVTALCLNALAGVDESNAEVLLACLIAAESRRSVQWVADACRVSVRTLEWRARRAGLPPISVILRWAVVLHIAWLFDEGHVRKRVADEMGFSTVNALSTFTKRTTGQGCRAVAKAGFAGLLESFSAFILENDRQENRGNSDALARVGSGHLSGFAALRELLSAEG